MNKGKKGSYENLQSNIRDLITPSIEVFENIYSNANYTINFEFPEFTAICPKTGLPDFGVIFIEYIPDRVCLELKSLKEYFLFYRDIGIFHENVVNKVYDDILSAAKPRHLKIRAKYNVRGGLYTEVERNFTTLEK